MQRTVQELFTYPATDKSVEARQARAAFHCPILNVACTKNNDDGAEENDPVLYGPLGVCSVFNPQPPGPSPVTCLCPARLYDKGYPTLRRLAKDVLEEPSLETYMFGEWLVKGAPDGIVLVGKNEPGEVRTDAGSLDWVAAYCRGGRLVKYAGIEAQAIDTTGNYRANRAALMREDTDIPASGHGLNWENVNKRIIPQLLRKGVLLKELSGEHAVGLGFLVDANVYSKFETRLGSPLQDDSGFNLVIHAYSLS
ncbi:MAG: NotI family restriction endonuclease, partial [Actinomycetota bacterium]|nr:NotI family restriction endonuclease [Actinomycetota bacterium]